MGWASVLKTGIKVVKHGEHVGGKLISQPKNVFLSGVSGWLAWSAVSGDGMINGANKMIAGKKNAAIMEKKGLAGEMGNLLFGEDGKDKPLAENVIDNLSGEGSYDKLRNAGGAVVDEGTGMYRGVKNMLVGPEQPSPNMQYADMQQGQLLYDANGNVVGAYPGAGAYNPQQVAAMQSANPFNSMGSFVSQMSGGKVSGLNALEIMAAAYMMFGSRFGWLGKIAGALIGGTAAKDITNRSAMIQQQQMMGGYGVQPAYPQQQYVPQYPQQQLQQSQEEGYTVQRGRGMHI